MKHLFLLSGIGALLLGGCTSYETTGNIPAVRNFELSGYLGKWYEIARLPHSFEKGMSRVSAEYTAESDGTVRVVNSGEKNGVRKEIRGIAKWSGEKTRTGELRVSFFRPFYGNYRIIHLSPDYTLAIVTSSEKNYLWILARKPEIPQSVLQDCLRRIKAWGFDTEKLIVGQ